MFMFPARKQKNQRCGGFISNCSGNITIAFGLSAVVMFASGGGAVDFARWYNLKGKLHSAMDAAALAGGRALQLSPTDDYSVGVAVAQQHFERMKPAGVSGAPPTFTVTENGTVLRGEGVFSLASPFLAMIGIPYLSASLKTEAVIAAGGNAGTNLEVSLMLDTTGSMSGQKIEDLKLAAKDLIDIAVWADQGQYTSKVALAPFSSRVNVGAYIDKVSDVQSVMNFSGTDRFANTCVTDRTGAEALTDAKPVGVDMLSAYRGDKGEAAKANYWNYSSSGGCSTAPGIVPLTSDKTALKARIDTLPASGSTAGALGTAWAWYMLSPKWTGIWQGDNLPAPYSDITALGPKGQPKLQKVAVLMTDGIYNTTLGVNHGDTSAEAQAISARAVTLCTNMKAAGIKVYTVGFQLEGNQLAIDTLTACASSEATDPAGQSSYFFSAANGAELRGAFRQIALKLSMLRLRS